MVDIDSVLRQFREVGPPLTRSMLKAPGPNLRRIQFSREFSDKDYRKLAKWMSKYPHLALRVYATIAPGTPVSNLDFLRHFPTLRHLQADANWDLESIDGLRFLPDDLESLSLGTYKKKLALSPLARFTSLRSLGLDGQQKDLEAIRNLDSLETVAFRSITLPDLRVLEKLNRLSTFALSFGGTKDLSALAGLPALRTLSVDWVSGMSDLSPISDMTSLEHLDLACMRQVRVIPDLSGLTNLRSMSLETMKGITDLRPLLTAPHLERLVIVNMPHLSPEDVGVLSQHPTLKQLGVGLGSVRKNAEAQRLAGVPPLTA